MTPVSINMTQYKNLILETFPCLYTCFFEVIDS